MSDASITLEKSQNTTLIPMVILTSLFFIFGFVTWLNGPLIPFFKLACELTESQAYFVTFAFGTPNCCFWGVSTKNLLNKNFESWRQ